MFFGPCSSCAGKDLKRWQALAKRYPKKRIVIVSRDTQQGIDQYIKTTHFVLPIVEDASGILAKRFNASWVPRAYQIDTAGTLHWLQRDDTVSPDQMVAQLWETEPGGTK